MLICSNNQLSSLLDVSKNIALTTLDCSSNQLSSLDVSKSIALTRLNCFNNQLTSLDVSKNQNLTLLWCNANNFTTQTFNDLMCSLPAREESDKAEFRPLWDASDSKATNFKATNSRIAKDKNWKVMYLSNNIDIPATTGSYVCPSTSLVEAYAEALSLYPNPVENVLYINTEGEIRSIHIYNVYGTEVATATGTAEIDLSGLPAGVYAVQVNTDKGIATQSVMKK